MADKGKNKRKQLETFDSIHQKMLSVDSQEEIDFKNWCEEAVQLSILNDFVYQPCAFQLFDSAKYVDVDGRQRTLYRDHIYSPDFLLKIDPSQKSLLKELKASKDQLSGEVSAYIDVKGTFNRNARSFSTDRKWLWQKFKVFICEVIPQKFFALFGCPEASRLTAKTKKPRACFSRYKSVKEAFSH